MLEVFDSNGIYVVVIIITLAIASLLGLVLFANKEETFEDVVAAQKKEQEALLNSLQGNSSKSGKSNKKWNKLKKKKAAGKDGEEHDADSGVDDEEPSSESIIAPKALPEENAAPLHQVSENEKKNEVKAEKPKKKKNKNKKQVVTEDEVKASEDVNIVESGISYPDEEEIIVSTEEISSQAEPELPPEAPTPVIPETKKKPKPVKIKPVKAKKPEGSILGPEKLVAEIESAQLNSNDMQQVIDMLLAKQNDQEKWQKPNQKLDPLEQLKKLLMEREDQLAEEQQKTQVVLTKNKELRMEIQQSRTQRQTIQGQATIFAQQAKEQETIRKRLEEQHLSEKQSTQTQIQRLQELIDGASHDELHKLQEENNHLKTASLRAQQLAEDKSSLMNELNQLQQNNKQLRQELDNTIHQYKQSGENQNSFQEKIIYLQKEIQTVQHAKNESETALSQRLQGVNEELLKLEAKYQDLLRDHELSKQGNTAVQLELETLQKSSPVSDDEVSALQKRLTEEESKYLTADASVKELQHQVETQNAEKVKYQHDLKEIQIKLKDAEKAITAANNEELEIVKSQVVDKDQQIKELNLKIAASETVGKVDTPDDNEKIDKLTKEVEELKNNEKAMEDSIANLKEKNNGLREKNWKAMDAMGTMEKEMQGKVAGMEKMIYKGLKELHPQVSIPKSTDNMDQLFNQYDDKLKSYKEEENKKTAVVIKELKDEIERLSKLETAPKETNHDDSLKEDLKKAEEEKTQLKGVLSETESMLGRLQAGVDAEVAKWQLEVESKTGELEKTNLKVKELEEALKKQSEKVTPQVEIQQSSVPDKELEEKLKNLESQLGEANKQRDSSKSEVSDLNTKLKKTISERDLLIREFKVLKETSTKTEVDLKTLNEDQLKAAKKLLDEISAPNAKMNGVASEKEKDEIITNLYKEIEELKQEVKDEQDSVVIDIETPDKKVQGLEAKLKAAESKIQELEAKQTEKIQNEIEEAMQQLKEKSNIFEKNLEQEKLINKQLRVQLSAATTSDIGTSV